MKRMITAVATLTLLIGLLAGTASAAEQPDLALEEVSLNMRDIVPGDQVTYVVQWRLTMPERDQMPALPYTISLVTADDRQLVQSEPITGVLPDLAQTNFLTGTLVAPGEGQYALVVDLDPENALGEAESTRNNNSNAAAPWTFKVESALPPSIVNVFAGLGMFAAVMAIVAVGAEVVIDTLRVVLGTKSKVTAMEALRRMEHTIPGKLESLGVNAVDREALKSTLAEMRDSLAMPLAAAEMAVDLRAGRFQAAFATVQQQWEAAANALPPLERAEQLVEQARRAFVQSLQELLTTHLGLAPDAVARLTRSLDLALTQFVREKQAAASPITPGQLLGVATQFFQDSSEIIIGHWLEAHGQALVAEGQSAMDALFTKQLGPFLSEDLGLSNEAIEQIRLQTAYAVNYLSDRVLATSGNYIASVKQLLLAVESRRNETQSPFRKAWRKARNTSLPLWAVIQGTLLAVLLGVLLSLVAAELSNLAQALLVGLGLLMAIAVTGLVQALFTATVERELLRRMSTTATLPPQLPANVRQELRRMTNARLQNDCDLQIRAHALLQLSAGESIGDVAQRLNVSQTTIYRWIVDYLVQRDAPLRSRLAPAPDQGGNAASVPFSLHEPWTRRILLFSLGDLLWALESGWNFLRRQPNERGRIAEEVQEQLQGLNPNSLAAILQERDDKHRDEEASRLRLLRALAFIIGLTLAFLLQIDAAVLLERIVPGVSRLINFQDFFVVAEVFRNGEKGLQLLTNPPPGTAILLVMRPGIILTGLAASAGSAYWHDVLDRLQASKKEAETAAKMLRQARTLSDGED